MVHMFANKFRKILVCLGLFSCCFLCHPLVFAQEDSMRLQTGISTQKLEGRIDERDEAEKANLASIAGKEGQKNHSSDYLQGSAQMGEYDGAKEDPDAGDKELMIAWDRWRNRFLNAVLASTSEILNSDQGASFRINPTTHVMEPKYPVGTVAWFVCEVTRDKQIKHLKILNSSGYADYDKAVLEAVQDLQGSSLLRFPTGSRRTAVLQGGAVERAVQNKPQYFHFDDVERYRIPGY